MRLPRLLVPLVVIVLLIAFGAWRFVGAKPAEPLVPPSEASAVQAADAPASALDATEETRAELESAQTSARAPALAAPKPRAAPVASSTRLRGRVVRGPGRTPVAGASVRCAESADGLPEGLLRRDLSGAIDGRGIRSGRPVHKPHPECTSGADGRFEFGELDPQQSYTLSASAPGSGFVEDLRGLAPSDDEHLLVVQTVYRADLVALDENGEGIDAHGLEFLRYAQDAQVGDCRALELPEVRRARAALGGYGDLGLDDGLHELESSRAGTAGTRSYRFASDCDASRLGPFKVLVCCPGFERQDFEFYAWPADVQAPPTQLRLSRRSHVGSLLVHQDCSCTSAVCGHLCEGTLELESTEDGVEPRTLELSGRVREQQLVDLRAGSWRARVRARSGTFAFPPRDEPAAELVIGDGAQAILRVPVGNLGALRFQLGDGNGLPARGDALLECVGVSGPGARVPLWPGVLLRGIEAGPHEFRIVSRTSDPGVGHVPGSTGGDYDLRVEAKAGETVVVPVQMP